MSWTLICTTIAFLIYIIYNGIAIKQFGIPNSLSDTYYLYQAKKPWMRFLFPIMMFSIVALLMPAWLEISAFSNLQFLAFLAAGSIAFTGAAPAFKGNTMESTIHSVSAIGAAVFALLWVIFVSKTWILIIIWLITFIAIALLTKSLKQAKIYWLENVAFFSTFLSIIFTSIFIV